MLTQISKRIKYHLGYFLVGFGNFFISYTPFWSLRRFYYRLLGLKIDSGSKIQSGTFILHPNKIIIGKNCVISHQAFLDGRGCLEIGNCISISFQAAVLTMTHNHQSPTFEMKVKKVVLEDYCWIGMRSLILPGITVGEGAVVAAGAVVNHDVLPYTIVGGVPAKEIGKRTHDLQHIPQVNHLW